MKKPLRLSRLLLILFFVAEIIWIFLPVSMAVLWSFVDRDYPWSFPDLFPQKLSFSQWIYVWRYTNIQRAIQTSYTIALFVAMTTMALGLPTAYALGRNIIKGSKAIQIVMLIPIIIPGMVVALFLAPVFLNMRLSQTMLGIVLGHTFLALPYMVRIMATSFGAIPQDIIDAAKNLGAGRITIFFKIYLPMISMGLIAALIFVFVVSLEEFNLSFIIGMPTFETIPTILYSFLGYNFSRSNASVVSLILTVPNVLLLLLIERLLKANHLSAIPGKG